MTDRDLIQTIRHNCDISDARDNGIYSICALVLKLRNLYKWEHNIEPWQEPESGDLLDWIETKENYWETIRDNEFQPIVLQGKEHDPFEVAEVNDLLSDAPFAYGAGYGRSLKAIFFLAEKLRQESVEGIPVVILGREHAKELSSPIAMLQDGNIIIRREPMRFFFWDQIQEVRSSGKASIHHALSRYGIMDKCRLDQDAFKRGLDAIVDSEIPIFIYHEAGERLQKTFHSDTLKKIISTFPDSAIEFVARAVKDVLADTHPHGMLHFIIRERRDASLGFYVGFLAGLRKVLSSGIINGFEEYLKHNDWQSMELARIACRDSSLALAEKINAIAERIGKDDAGVIKLRFNEEVLTPLGLEAPTA